MTKSLKEYAKSKSSFVSIKADDSCTAIYKGYKFIEKDSFGETKECVRYLLEDLEDGVVRSFDSQSAALAEQMDSIKEGAKIKISRTGEGMETKYQVESVDEQAVERTEEEIPIIEEDENA